MLQIPILFDFAFALIAAFIGGLLARRIGLPAIVGYLVAGILIGPYTPGYVNNPETIGQMAELGVIFLMFGVGLNFSLQDLWRVRDIAIGGALILMIAVGALAFALSQAWGWPVASGLILAIALGNASTVVMMRGLMDHSLLNTPHGQAAVGLQVMQDLVTIFVLLLLPALGNSQNSFDWGNLGIAVLKAAAFLLFAFLAGKHIIHWLFRLVMPTRSRELFILAVLGISVGTALGAAEIFGVSLALGAFVAGAVVSESPISHQIGADILPFREAFAVLFFVSIGMLINPLDMLARLDMVLALFLVIILGKSILTTLMGGLFPRPARTALVIAAGSSQIGEFSFILGSTAMVAGLIDQDQYSLILSGALLSISVNPVMFNNINRVEGFLRRFPAFWRWLDRHGPSPAPIEESLAEHVVIVGYGRVGRHIGDVLNTLHTPMLVIESDVERVEELNRQGILTIYGDAANSEVLRYANLPGARLLVTTTPTDIVNEIIVTTARSLAPDLPIIARAGSIDGLNMLEKSGAQVVIHPELEGGLHLLRHTLLSLGYPLLDVYKYADSVRADHYDPTPNTPEEHRMLNQLLSAVQNIEVDWYSLSAESALVGQTLAQADIRARSGASVVAIYRQGKLIANPKSQTVFEPGDRLGLIGDQEHLQAAEALLKN